MKKIALSDYPTIRRIIGDLSRKRTAYISQKNPVTISGTYWDGGSRSEYYQVDIRTGRAQSLGSVAPPQFGGPAADPVVTIEPGSAIVRVGIFLGRPVVPTVYLPTDSPLIDNLAV